jgi:uncharacterized protein (DUF433 family)
MRLPEFLVDHPDGEIRLTGHRISLYDVVSAVQDGETTEEIHTRFPSVPRRTIEDVIAFHRQNRDEVDAYVAAYRADLDRLLASLPQAGPRLAGLWLRVLSGELM